MFRLPGFSKCKDIVPSVFVKLTISLVVSGQPCVKHMFVQRNYRLSVY